MDHNLVLCEYHEDTAIITLNRENALNALNSEMLNQLKILLQKLQKEDSLKCVIITGAGSKAFAAGADISEMAVMDEGQADAWSRLGQEVCDLIEEFPVPMIAGINGYALGGGWELALACDIRIAEPDSKVGSPETGLGVSLGYGGTYRLNAIAGTALARELVFTGRQLTGEEAFALGLVNGVSVNLMADCLAMAKNISEKSKSAVAFAKTALTYAASHDKDSTMQLERSFFSKCFAHQDQKQRMAKYIK